LGIWRSDKEKGNLLEQAGTSAKEKLEKRIVKQIEMDYSTVASAKEAKREDVGIKPSRGDIPAIAGLIFIGSVFLAVGVLIVKKKRMGIKEDEKKFLKEDLTSFNASMLLLNFPIGVIVFPEVTLLIKKQMLPDDGKNATSPFLKSDLALSIPESTAVSKYKILCPNR